MIIFTKYDLCVLNKFGIFDFHLIPSFYDK